MPIYTLLQGNKSIFTHQADSPETFVLALAEMIPSYYDLVGSTSAVDYRRNPAFSAFHNPEEDPTYLETMFVEPLVAEYLSEIDLPVTQSRIEIDMDPDWVLGEVNEMLTQLPNDIVELPPYKLASSRSLWHGSDRWVNLETVGLFDGSECLYVSQIAVEPVMSKHDLTLQHHFINSILATIVEMKNAEYVDTHPTNFHRDVRMMLRPEIEDDHRLVKNLFVPVMSWWLDHPKVETLLDAVDGFVRSARLRIIALSPFEITVR